MQVPRRTISLFLTVCEELCFQCDSRLCSYNIRLGTYVQNGTLNYFLWYSVQDLTLVSRSANKLAGAGNP